MKMSDEQRSIRPSADDPEAKRFLTKLGKVVRRRRVSNGSQNSLSAVLGQAAISHVEIADRASRFPKLSELASAFNISLPRLFLEAEMWGRAYDQSERCDLHKLSELLDWYDSPFDHSDFKKRLGGTIRRLRAGSDFRWPRTGLRELAKEARIDHSFLSRFERGKSDISTPMLISVCGVLHISIASALARATLRFKHLSPSELALSEDAFAALDWYHSA